MKEGCIVLQGSLRRVSTIVGLLRRYLISGIKRGGVYRTTDARSPNNGIPMLYQGCVGP